MTRYIALLRGINVNGVTIRMADLSRVLRDLGLDEVRTVLASGNAAFSSERTDAAALAVRIETALGEAFGYDARIVLLTRERLAAVVEAFPFDATREGWHPYVLFSSDPSAIGELTAAAKTVDPADDVVEAGSGVIYWHNRREVGIHSEFSKIAGKVRYRAATTSRNLRTLVKLLA